jgi:hypothetical protein
MTWYDLGAKVEPVRFELSQDELDRIHAEKLERLRIKGLALLTPEERKLYS